MKICPNCGTEVERLFCPDCGTKVEEENVRNIDLHVEESVETPVEKLEEVQETEATEEASYEVRQEIVPVPNTQREYKTGDTSATGKISPKSTSIIAYIGWIGLIIAFIIGDRQGGKFHLNQALVINLAAVIFSIVGPMIPFLGTLVALGGDIFALVCWGLGLYYAITGQEKEVPLLGQIRLL